MGLLIPGVIAPERWVDPPEDFLLGQLLALQIHLQPEALAPYLCNARIVQMTGGWRAGKSFVTALWQFARLGYGELHWMVAPDYMQAKNEFGYLAEFCRMAGILQRRTESKRDSNYLETTLRYPLESMLQPDVPGKTVMLLTKSAALPEKLAGDAPATITMVEAGQQSADVRENLVGRTSERRAPLFMSGTLEKDVGWYADFYEHNQAGDGELYRPGAEVFNLPSHSNLSVYPLGENDPEILYQRQQLGADLYAEKFLGIPQRVRHRVFDNFWEPKRSVNVPPWGRGFDPNRPIELAIDPGHAHRHAVLAFQMDGKTAWVVDSLWLRQKTCQQIIDLLKERAWWGKVGYWVMDIAGRATGPDGRSYADIYEANLPGIPFRMTKVPLMAGYDRHKECLLADWGDPKLMILDRQGALGPLQWEYNHHQWKLNSAGEPITELPNPINDDAIKAATYYLWDKFGATGQEYDVSELTSVKFQIVAA